jgi:hypothetical protein
MGHWVIPFGLSEGRAVVSAERNDKKGKFYVRKHKRPSHMQNSTFYFETTPTENNLPQIMLLSLKISFELMQRVRPAILGISEFGTSLAAGDIIVSYPSTIRGL